MHTHTHTLSHSHGNARSQGLSWKIAGPLVCLAYYLIFGLGLSSIVLSYVRAKAAPGTRRIHESDEADLKAIMTRRALVVEEQGT